MTRTIHLSGEAWRAAVIAVAMGVLFLSTGRCTPPWVANLVGGAPIELDVSLRALSSGWFTTDRTVPITIVDIDDATHAAWGRPAMTPRGDLARLVATVVAAEPRALVVDIDVGWGGPSQGTDSGQVILRRILDEYRASPPIVFPKRVLSGSAGARSSAPSDLDDLIGSRPNLVWAHVAFTTGEGGAVRDWAEWVDVCDGATARRLPAVAAVVTTFAERGPTRAAADPVMDCAAADLAPERRLLLGPRMTGPARVPSRQVQSISAALLLDSTVARDDAALFRDRVVLIGATHPDAGDLWLSPRGLVPGVELIASTIHYAPLARGDGFAATLAYRSAAVALFLGLALLTWHLIGIPMILGVIGAALATTGVAVGVLGWFWYFDALGAALVMIVGYEAFRAILELGVSIRTEIRQAKGPLRRRLLTALRNVSLRDQEATDR